MELNTLYIVLAIPCAIALYAVYEMVKMGNEREG